MMKIIYGSGPKGSITTHNYVVKGPFGSESYIIAFLMPVSLYNVHAFTTFVNHSILLSLHLHTGYLQIFKN